MSDALKLLRAYLEGDPVAIMSRRNVGEVIAEIMRLRALLKGARKYRYRPNGMESADLFARIDVELKGEGE